MIDYPLYFMMSPAFFERNPPMQSGDDWRPFGDWPSLMHLLSVSLAEAGVPVQSISSMPKEGVVIAHTGDLNLHSPPPPGVYLVCYQGDWERSLWAHEHIVANHFQATCSSLSRADRLFGVGLRYHLPFIPEPRLTPRSQERGDRFEQIAYMGTPYNLIPELQTVQWTERMKKLGLIFHVESDVSKHGDYTDVDAIVAVRPSDRNPNQKFANKLWNSWRAGVPAILGPEPGFQEARIGSLDYMEAANADEIYEALSTLAKHPDLRRQMIANGHSRCHECSKETIVNLWIEHLKKGMRQSYFSWRNQKTPWKLLDQSKRLLRYRIKTLRAGQS